MIDQLKSFAVIGAFTCGMTRGEIETEFNLDCADVDKEDEDKLHNIGRLINRMRAIEASLLVDELKAHFADGYAVTLAAAILSKKA